MSKKPLGCLIEIAETLILTIVIFWLIQTFVAQPFKVEQQSMSGTLEEGEYVLVDKLTPHFDTHSRGDIVVFLLANHAGSCADPPGERLEETPYIKRVIGEPGDEVRVENGDVFVNGVPIEEPYVHGQLTSGDDSWLIQEGELFVMGDNRQNSSDSRQFGPICSSDVVGRAWLRYWPVNTIGVLQTPTYPNVPERDAPAPGPSPRPIEQ